MEKSYREAIKVSKQRPFSSTVRRSTKAKSVGCTSLPSISTWQVTDVCLLPLQLEDTIGLSRKSQPGHGGSYRVILCSNASSLLWFSVKLAGKEVSIRSRSFISTLEFITVITCANLSFRTTDNVNACLHNESAW